MVSGYKAPQIAASQPTVQHKHAAALDVNTSYRIDATSLLRTVELTEHTQFPVVVDPKLTFGLGVYLNLSWSTFGRCSPEHPHGARM